MRSNKALFNIIAGLSLAVALILQLAAGSLSLASDGSPLDRFNPDQKKKLLAGEAVFEHVKTSGPDGKIEGHGQASILINKPIEYCFKIFCEFDKQQLYFPRKKKSEIVKITGNKVLVYKLFDFKLAKIEYTVLYTVDPKNYRVDFRMDPSYPHDLNNAAGFFLFERADENRTLFTYAATKVDTGLKVPSALQDYLTSRDLPNVVINVKKRIESGGVWTKKE